MPPCVTSLRRQHSLSRCAPGRTFGCHGDSAKAKVWISGGCRGTFMCNGLAVQCGRPRAWLFTKLLYAGIIHRVMVHVSAAANVEHVAAPPGFKLEGDDEFMFAFHAAVDPQNHTLLAFAHKE
uniref:Uncharacterized protein n=1 Tax=Emiliania huxleyi TaxID=2903 RepID=A0A7S3TRG3_EMIHU|mmetsp:Transcript_21841/g.64306  ORF Transcript_21841/g.64306 Transcript_21841/m.64306 type:complete len:123 (+) Transcript_21841:70-438(+)